MCLDRFDMAMAALATLEGLLAKHGHNAAAEPLVEHAGSRHM